MVELYAKPPLEYEQQLLQLKERGLVFEDDKPALHCLKTISYYRLSAYRHPLRKINQGGALSDDFVGGSQFKEVLQLYEFDHRLRLLLMDAIGRIEVCIRALFAYQIGCKYGTFGHAVRTTFARTMVDCGTECLS